MIQLELARRVGEMSDGGFALGRELESRFPELALRGHAGGAFSATRTNGAWKLGAFAELTVANEGGNPLDLAHLLLDEDVPNQTRQRLRALSADARFVLAFWARAVSTQRRVLSAVLNEVFAGAAPVPVWSHDLADRVGIHASTLRTLLGDRVVVADGLPTPCATFLFDSVGNEGSAGETLVTRDVRLESAQDDFDLYLALVFPEAMGRVDASRIVAIKRGPEDGVFEPPARLTVPLDGAHRVEIRRTDASRWEPHGVATPADGIARIDITEVGTYAFLRT